MAVDVLEFSAGNSASTTASGAVGSSDTTIGLVSDTNFSAKSGAGMLLIDEGTATEELAYSTGITGGTATIPLANRGLEGGSAQTHASGATIKGIFSAAMWNNLIDAVALLIDKTTGLIKSNITLTAPIIATFYQDAGKTKLMTTPNTASDTLAAIAATQTLTNKRITPRVVTATDDATAVIDVDVTDQYQLTAVANATEFTVTGTPVNGQKLLIRLKDAGTGKGLTWTGFTAIGCTAPTTTVAGKTHYIGCIYNSATPTWNIVAVAAEA